MALAPRAVIPVDLFGQPADYRSLLPVAERHGLKVLADAAQSFGAQLDGRKAGTWGDATATSFFPAKPLGCYGDGGAVFTDDEELASTLRSLRVHAIRELTLADVLSQRATCLGHLQKRLASAYGATVYGLLSRCIAVLRKVSDDLRQLDQSTDKLGTHAARAVALAKQAAMLQQLGVRLRPMQQLAVKYPDKFP